MSRLEGNRQPVPHDLQELAALDEFNVSMVAKIINTSIVVSQLIGGVNLQRNVLTESEVSLLETVYKLYIVRHRQTLDLIEKSK